MAERTVTIGSKVGLHARPAAIFVKAAAQAAIPVTVRKDGGTPVNAASILAVMALGAKYQESVTIAADGDGADAVLDRLAELLAKDLDAE
ncbi:HPr family phosphocarrier protein [Georgenia sunbinii]|uniref:HPr family phosphocarrier protein n=1 Tax=Georgenia sunbinii TaxID=3117728 RepID=UPI002F260542